MEPRIGIDFVAWRGCAKQKELGQARFVQTLKTMAEAIERLPLVPAQLPDPSTAVSPDRKRQIQMFVDVKKNAAAHAKGTPECEKCSVSGGKPFGCHAFVRKPIDEAAEQALFNFFATNVVVERSTAESLYKDLVSAKPENGTIWHTDRGPAGGHAKLPEVLEHKWGFFLMRKRLDSAQVLGSIFFPMNRIGLIAAFAKFWTEFFTWVRSSSISVAQSPTLMELAAVQQLYTRTEEASSTESGVAMLVEE